MLKEVGSSKSLNWAASDGVAALRLITPDPDRLPIWIWIIATSSMKEVFAKRPREVGAG